MENFMKRLYEVRNPVRYIGGEVNSVRKNFEEKDCRILLSLPDLYEIGMSNLGLSILYSILNNREDALCERVYLPGEDAEKIMRQEHTLLFSLESRRPARDFDLFGFSLPYELIYPNVLNMLDLAGIKLMAEERTDDEPFIIGGGACVYNAEPVADFFDFFMVGEAEELFGEVVDEFKEWKAAGKEGGRRGFLKRLLKLGGIYVPRFYEPQYEGDKYVGMKVSEDAPRQILKRIVKDLDATPTVDKPIVPYMKIVHDRAMLEIFRGCSRGCRFCQAGMTYRPVRERKVSTLRQIARRLIDSSGWDEISLTSLSSADYSCLNHLIDELREEFRAEKVSCSLPSLRVDSFSVELAERVQAVRKSGLTFAPEAGTQRLRDVINKNVTEEDLIKACSAAFEKGWKAVKLYFMIGLPTETDEDIEGIADLARKVSKLKRGVKVKVSVSCFVPKPWTPFQWVEQISVEEFERRQNLLKKIMPDRAIDFDWHDARTSVIEGILARGDRRLSRAILTAWQRGSFISIPTPPSTKLGEPLPWEHISPGVDAHFLINEWVSIPTPTPDCRSGNCTNCGVCAALSTHPSLGVVYFNPRTPQHILAGRDQTIIKYVAQMVKGAELAALSHLNYMAMIRRALIRSKLPVVWTNGFNPHVKLSYLSDALAVGKTSDSVQISFSLSSPLDIDDIIKRINDQLPAGAKIISLHTA